jgi:amino acid permease
MADVETALILGDVSDSGGEDSELSVSLGITELKPGHTRVGFFGNLINLLNVLVGAGILGIPSTFDSSGIVISVFVATLITGLSYIATAMTLILQEETESEGIDEIAQKLLGRLGLFCLSISILIFNVCALIAFLILGTDFILSWLRVAGIDASGRWPRALVVFVYGLVIPIALSIPKSLRFLSLVSGAAIFFILFYMVATIIELAQGDSPRISPTIVIAALNLKIFAGIAVYALAFALPGCICPVICDYHESLAKRKFSAFLSLLISLIITIIPSIFAYLKFGDATQGNVIDSYADGDPLMIAVRVGFFIVVSFSWPLTHPAVAASWSAMIYRINNPIDLEGMRRAVILIVSNSIPLAIAMFLKEVRPALEVGGAIGGCIGNFSFPALMWVVHSDQAKTHWTNILAIALFVFGIGAAIVSTYYAVEDAIGAFRE